MAALAILNTVTASAAGMVSCLPSSACIPVAPRWWASAPVWLRALWWSRRVRALSSRGRRWSWAWIVSPVCYLAISHLKTKFGYDDALDAFGCHGIGGILGGVLTGLFCVPELSWTGKGGLFYTGDVSLLVSQILGIVVTVAIVLVLDLVTAAVVKALFHGACTWTRPTRRWAWTRVSMARALTPRSPDSISSFPKHRTLPFNRRSRT